MKKLIFSGLASALGVGVYVAAVSLIMQNGERLFGTGKNYLAPVAFLLIFVLSAAITGFLVFGRPIMMYLDNKKVQAIQLLGYTLAWLFVITMVLLVILVWY
ncbi:MAG: hypothetical protein WC310_01900 [Patescibacteria group bacterium]|jgi:hypothetical protein